MAPEFIRLLALEKMRSFSFGRDFLSALLVFILIAFVLLYLIGLALFLGLILKNFFEVQNVPAALSSGAIYYLFAELLSRFIFQKKPLFDLNSYLHLPIKKSGIIHYLLARSLFSPFSLVVILLFVPVVITDISTVYGTLSAWLWIGTLFLFSIALHFIVLWLKEVTDGRPAVTLFLFIIASAPFILLYFEIFNIGDVAGPFFALSFSGPVPLVSGLVACALSYTLIYKRYLASATLDRTDKQGYGFMSGTGSNLFGRFGLAGAYADMELKLILRHKKSRGFLILSTLALFYGLFMYRMLDGDAIMENSALYLFVSILMISIFFMNYGQFFLSWNSASFDFFMSKKNGLEALVRGKLLLLITISFFAYLITLPYIYFGWEIVLFHTAALLYNVGIGIHAVTRLSFWEPKPMDLNKGAMFNYDGIGVAQFLMAIPFFLLPYVVYVPVSMLFDPYSALAVVGLSGLVGIAFYDKLVSYNVRELQAKRHKISSSFRRGT